MMRKHGMRIPRRALGLALMALLIGGAARRSVVLK